MECLEQVTERSKPPFLSFKKVNTMTTTNNNLLQKGEYHDHHQQQPARMVSRSKSISVKEGCTHKGHLEFHQAHAEGQPTFGKCPFCHCQPTEDSHQGKACAQHALTLSESRLDLFGVLASL